MRLMQLLAPLCPTRTNLQCNAATCHARTGFGQGALALVLTP